MYSETTMVRTDDGMNGNVGVEGPPSAGQWVGVDGDGADTRLVGRTVVLGVDVQLLKLVQGVHAVYHPAKQTGTSHYIAVWGQGRS